MTCIRVRDVVQEVMAAGYLTLHKENQLRRMLQTTINWQLWNMYIIHNKHGIINFLTRNSLS